MGYQPIEPTSKKRKILVVDDDEAFATFLKNSLTSVGYQIITAPNGRVAEQLIHMDQFDAVITDIRMPDGNGIRLLHAIKKFAPIPVILMTGYPEFDDPNEPYEMGAHHFFTKPFKLDALYEVLANLFGEMHIALEATTESQDLDYCKVDIQDFISGKELQYDVFIRLSEAKYVKIAPKGESLSQERVKSYKNKDIHFLYMKKADFVAYVGFSVNLSKVIKTSESVNKYKKLQFMKHATEVVLEQLHLEGINEESFDQARTVLDSTLSVMTDTEDVMTMLSMLSEHSDFLYSHSLGVSIHATMIAKAVGWRSPMVLFKIAMGGLLHDIGKKEVPIEILYKPRTQLTLAEIRSLESHTIRGAEILSSVSTIPGDVVQIAAQHHENLLGLGYPASLKGQFIHPMAKLVAVANEFCDLVIKKPSVSHPLTPTEAIHKMSILFSDTLDHNFFLALTKLYSVKLQPEYEETLKRKLNYVNGL